jgi:hypothetical protein
MHGIDHNIKKCSLVETGDATLCSVVHSEARVNSTSQQLGTAQVDADCASRGHAVHYMQC